MADQTNAEVSDERLREIEQAILLLRPAGNIAYNMKHPGAVSPNAGGAAYEFGRINDAVNAAIKLLSSARRSVTSQASEGEVADPKRKHGYTVNLTEQEMDALEALAQEHDLPPWRVLLQGLRLYQSVAHPVDLGPMLDPSLVASPVSKRVERLEAPPFEVMTSENVEMWARGLGFADYHPSIKKLAMEVEFYRAQALQGGRS